jgi:hypothetical protein
MCPPYKSKALSFSVSVVVRIAIFFTLNLAVKTFIKVYADLDIAADNQP